MTAAERAKAMRQRRKDAGLISLRLYVKPEHKAQIEAYAAKLAAD